MALVHKKVNDLYPELLECCKSKELLYLSISDMEIYRTLGGELWATEKYFEDF